MSGERRCVVYVVDDEEAILRMLKTFLMLLGYDVITCSSGVEALRSIPLVQPDIILLDVHLQDLDGFELLLRIREMPVVSDTPVVMITAAANRDARVRALELGATDFLSKPVDRAELHARVNSMKRAREAQLREREYKLELERVVAAQTMELQQAVQQLKRSYLDTIERLARAAEYKDLETHQHIVRIGHYTGAIARAMQLDAALVSTLTAAAPMHDIGKIGIPDSILTKPGKLSPAEREIMERHTDIGADILKNAHDEFTQTAYFIAKTHHEKWDGTGYPARLSGAQIPLCGRIVAVADVFDALTSRRPYKEPFSIEESFRIMRQGQGSHFDPEVLRAFFYAQEEILEIRERNIDDVESLFTMMMDFTRRGQPFDVLDPTASKPSPERSPLTPALREVRQRPELESEAERGSGPRPPTPEAGS